MVTFRNSYMPIDMLYTKPPHCRLLEVSLFLDFVEASMERLINKCSLWATSLLYLVCGMSAV